MADPAYTDIVADRRVPLTPHYAFLDVDWTGSTFKMQVRLARDTAGTPPIDVSPSLLYAGTATVAAHIAAGRLTEVPDGYSSGSSLTLSQIGLGISAATLSGLPFPEERGDDLEAWYDIIRIPASGDNEIVMRGQFIVRAGVTIP